MRVARSRPDFDRGKRIVFEALGMSSCDDVELGQEVRTVGQAVIDYVIAYIARWMGALQQSGGFQVKRKNCAVLVSALVLPLSIGAAYAKPVDPSKLPKVECSEVKFGEAFLAKYPKAPDACLEAREHNGKRYAKFDAKVYITGPDVTTVTLVNAKGDSLDTFSLKPGPDQTIKINGKDTKFSKLRVGEKITFWVHEGRMEAAELPGSTEDSWAVLPPIK